MKFTLLFVRIVYKIRTGVCRFIFLYDMTRLSLRFARRDWLTVDSGSSNWTYRLMNEKTAPKNVLLMIFFCYFPFIWRSQIGVMWIMWSESFSWFCVCIFSSAWAALSETKMKECGSRLHVRHSLCEIKDFDKIIFGFFVVVVIILLSFPLSLRCEYGITAVSHDEISTTKYEGENAKKVKKKWKYHEVL